MGTRRFDYTCGGVLDNANIVWRTRFKWLWELELSGVMIDRLKGDKLRSD